MNYFTRSLVSLLRNRGKSALIILVISVLGVFASGAIFINSAFQNTERALRLSLPPIAQVSVDMDISDQMWENGTWENYEMISREFVRTLEELPYVEIVDYSFRLHDYILRDGLQGVIYYMDYEIWGHIPNPTIKFVNRINFLDLYSGLIEIRYGRNFTEEDMTQPASVFPVLISTHFAEENSLMVGSMIGFYDPAVYEFSYNQGIYPLMPKIPHEAVIVGIFEVATTIIGGPSFQNEIYFDYLINQFYVPMWVSDSIMEGNLYYAVQLFGEEANDFRRVLGFPRFSLVDSYYIDRFEAVVNPLLPPDLYISYLSNIYEDISVAMNSLAWLFTLILIAAIWATLIILNLLVTLFLKDRKHEIGIYSALGEKKSRIISQLLLEVVLSGVLGLFLALIIGAWLAGSFSEALVYREIIRQSEQRTHLDRSFHPTDDALLWFSPEPMSHEEMLANFQMTLESETVILFLAGGILVLFVSTIIPIAYVLTLQPKKILL